MKRIFIVLIALLISAGNAYAGNCFDTVYNICMRQEAENSDISRGGMSRDEFCRAVAVSECTIGES